MRVSAGRDVLGPWSTAAMAENAAFGTISNIIELSNESLI
jgi:hypothetical protein